MGSLTAEGGKTRVATRVGASGVASDSITPKVAASCIYSSPSQMLGNKATCVRISARWALSADLRCLRLDPSNTLHRTMGALLGLLEVCFVRAMERVAALEGESSCSARRGRRRRQYGDLGNLRKLEAQRLQYLQARLIKQASRDDAALIWPSRPEQRATFEFERVYSGSGGSSLRRQRRVPRAR